MCYIGRLVILHRLYKFGNLTTGVKGMTMEQWQKNTKSDIKSTCLVRKAFYPGTQMRPSVMKSTSLSELEQYSCASLHFIIYKMIFFSFCCKMQLMFSFLQWSQHIAVSLNPPAAQLPKTVALQTCRG